MHFLQESSECYRPREYVICVINAYDNTSVGVLSSRFCLTSVWATLLLDMFSLLKFASQVGCGWNGSNVHMIEIIIRNDISISPHVDLLRPQKSGCLNGCQSLGPGCSIVRRLLSISNCFSACWESVYDTITQSPCLRLWSGPCAGLGNGLSGVGCAALCVGNASAYVLCCRDYTCIIVRRFLCTMAQRNKEKDTLVNMVYHRAIPNIVSKHTTFFLPEFAFIRGCLLLEFL